MRVKHSQKMSFVLTFKNLIADKYIPFIHVLMMKQYRYWWWNNGENFPMASIKHYIKHLRHKYFMIKLCSECSKSHGLDGAMHTPYHGLRPWLHPYWCRLSLPNYKFITMFEGICTWWKLMVSILSILFSISLSVYSMSSVAMLLQRKNINKIIPGIEKSLSDF